MNREQKPYLLIIAHGSRSQKWVDAIEAFTGSIWDGNRDKEPFFSGVSCCYLEHANPSIPDALQQLTQTHQTVIAVPFFLAPGVHVQRDVPELVQSVGTVIRNDEHMLHVQTNQSDIYLMPHISADDLLAQNALHRLETFDVGTENVAVILVYYGSKRFSEIWNELVQSIEKRIFKQYPSLSIRSVYAGDPVDFSPQPTVSALQELSGKCNAVIILPMLLGVGVIQTDVIPKAVEQAGLGSEVIYQGDSVLPDEQLAAEIWNHAKEFFQFLLRI